MTGVEHSYIGETLIATNLTEVYEEMSELLDNQVNVQNDSLF